MAERNKRNLPDWLFQMLEWDKKITKTAFEWFDGHFGYKKYRMHMKALELSGHGLIWLVVCFAMLYFGFDPSLWMNMLMLQVLDIILIAITKAIARRRRPALSEDDMFVSFLTHILRTHLFLTPPPQHTHTLLKLILHCHLGLF